MSEPGTGLSEAEARRRLERDGPNVPARASRKSLLGLAGEVFEEPMLLLLLGAGAVYMVLGDIHDALVLLLFAGFSVVIEFVQKGRTDRAIAALGEMAAPLALVIRDGERRRIASSQVVEGDLLVIAEGDRIVADGWLEAADQLQVDESVLTGESVSVLKRALATEEDRQAPPLPGGDNLPFVFSGTLAVRGNAIATIAATGPRSRTGRIGASLARLTTDKPRLAVESARMVRWFAAVGIGVSVLAGVLFGLTRGNWLEAVLAGIALAMSMLPEELPVVLTLFMTMGALRLSRLRVLARRGSAIESLGAATVLCSDKTGTITQNRMAIAELRLPDGARFQPGSDASVEIPEPFIELAGLGLLACLEQPFDPMETAFHELSRRHSGDRLDWRQDQGWRLHRQYGLSPDLLAVSHVWVREGERHLVAAKGAPEAIAELCDMPEAKRTDVAAAAGAMAAQGLRVLGVAEAQWDSEDLPESHRQFPYAFRGLVGLADPIRDTVPDAVRELRQAGLRVVMITGDHAETARAIARQAGIAEGDLLTGGDLAALNDDELAARIRGVSVFARVMPEDKLRIVQALKVAGEVVAMTGDGVNDAPSLKAAHIGVAMGRRGTEVAREASALVLLDDDFGAIPAAVRMGRRIYDNLRKAMAFIFAVHVPIAGLALAPLLTGWPIILAPMHIALLELVIDPVCSLAFEAEPEEPDVMRRPPRNPDSALFPRRLIGWSLLQGLVALALLIGLAAWTSHLALAEARTGMFAALVGAVLVLVVANRTFAATGGIRSIGRNVPLAILLAAGLAFFGLLFGVPAIAGLFRFALLDGAGLLAVIVLGAVLLAVLSLAKLRFRAALQG